MPVAAPTPQRAPGPSRSTRRPALSADTADAANLFALQKYGNIYSRIGNPTVAALEERIASLEGGIGAVATASGMAAEFITFAALVGAGDHVVASAALYGGTVTQLDVTLRRFGVCTTFVPGTDPADYAAAIRPETKVVYAEVIGNPSGEIADIAGLAEVAHAAGVPLVIDSTLATPYLCRPIEHGADIVIHSVTKFLGGHGTTLGGVVVESGRFDWGNGKFPVMTEPVAVYGGERAWQVCIASLELASHLANVGDARTLVIHPASTTHQQLSVEQLAAAGVPEDLIRISVGLEDVEDILWDLDQALTAAVGPAEAFGATPAPASGTEVTG